MLATITQYLIPFLLVLSVVVFVHEFGHYWVARRNGVRIEVFSIGFGPGAVRPQRPARHALEVQRRSRWAATSRCWATPMRPAPRSTSRTRAIRTASRPRASGSGWPSSSPGRSPISCSRSWRWRSCSSRSAARSPRPRSARSSRTARPRPPACCRATGSPRSTAADRELRGAAGDRARQCRPAAAVRRSSARASRWSSPSRRPMQRDRRTASATQHQVGLIGVSRAGVEYRRSNPFLAAVRGDGRDRQDDRRHALRLGEMVVGKRGTQELGGPLRIAQMSGADRPGRLRAGLVVHGRAVDQSRPDQPVPDPDAGRRPSRDVRHRGGARPAAQRAQPGDRLPLRAGHGAEPDGVRHLERRGPLRGDRVVCSNLIS